MLDSQILNNIYRHHFVFEAWPHNFSSNNITLSLKHGLIIFLLTMQGVYTYIHISVQLSSNNAGINLYIHTYLLHSSTTLIGFIILQQFALLSH